MNINTIYLRRARKIIVEKHTGNGRLADGYLAAAARNLEALGFALSPDLFRAVSVLPKEDFEVLYDQLAADLKVMLGAHVEYEPMYPGFPEQVMLEHEAILYLNAMYHYYTWDLPAYDGSAEREPLQEQVKLKTVGLGDREDFSLMLRRLIQAKGSISAADKEDIDAVIAALEPEELEEILPADIPFKENTAFVASSLLKHDKANLARLGRYFKTATDVLRLAAAWSDGDVSLAAPVRFRKFKRSERRLLLGLLEQCQPLTEDMLRYKDRWIRLGEILHPSEYKQRYARCEEAWDILRNNKPCTTFNSSVELALKYKQVWMRWIC